MRKKRTVVAVVVVVVVKETLKISIINCGKRSHGEKREKERVQ